MFLFLAHFTLLLQCEAAHGRMPTPCSVCERGERYGLNMKSVDLSQTEDRENGRTLGTKSKEVPLSKSAASVEEEIPTE